MKKKLPFIGSIEQHRELFEEMDDIIMIVNETGRIEYVNRALRRQLGYKTKRFTGRDISECSLFEETLRRKDILDRLFTQRDFFTRVRFKNRFFQYSWRTKIFVHQRKKKVIAVIRDMSTQLELQQKVEDYTKNLEEMVLHRTQQLEKEKRKAIELHQAKVVFLSKMSHELRTPLTAIRGYAEMLQEHDVAQQEKEKYLSVIEKNSKHLLEMINETLQLLQMEQNKYQIQEKVFHLRPLLKELIETYTLLATQKGLTLECQIPDDVPEKIFSDPKAVRQILTNLIGNAIKFTDKGNILLSMKQRFFSHQFSSKLYFYIEDSGVGIPADQQKRIFKNFEQYLDHQSSHTRGTGLGLPISRQLAKLLGGNVKLVSSEPYKGSTFVFILNVRNPEK